MHTAYSHELIMVLTYIPVDDFLRNPNCRVRYCLSDRSHDINSSQTLRDFQFHFLCFGQRKKKNTMCEDSTRSHRISREVRKTLLIVCCESSELTRCSFRRQFGLTLSFACTRRFAAGKMQSMRVITKRRSHEGETFWNVARNMARRKSRLRSNRLCAMHDSSKGKIKARMQFSHLALIGMSSLSSGKALKQEDAACLLLPQLGHGVCMAGNRRRRILRGQKLC